MCSQGLAHTLVSETNIWAMHQNKPAIKCNNSNKPYTLYDLCLWYLKCFSWQKLDQLETFAYFSDFPDDKKHHWSQEFQKRSQQCEIWYHNLMFTLMGLNMNSILKLFFRNQLIWAVLSTQYGSILLLCVNNCLFCMFSLLQKTFERKLV